MPTPRDLAGWVARNDYPVLDAQVLLRLLDQTNRLRSIERLAGTTPDVFDELFLSAIEAAAEAAQLVPASIHDHHREPGGWIDHTLEVVENALQARKRSILPPGSKPEAIHQVEFVWTYAVFATALLHDAGKLLSLTQLQPLPSGPIWTPGGLTLREATVTRYSITWARYPYELQTVSAITLLGLLPKPGLSMLLRDRKVLQAMIATLTDDWQSGPLGDIITQADQRSVRTYVTPGIAHAALPNAPGRPMSQRLMRALRMEIDEGALKLNATGGVGWVKDGSVWLVCKVIARRMREKLESEGASDIPEDERIYDILLDQGLIIPNETPARQSIWYVSIECDEYTHHLTMLRFERSTIIHRSKRVDEFEGEIVPLSREAMLARRAEARETARQAALQDQGDEAKPVTSTAGPATDTVDDNATIAGAARPSVQNEPSRQDNDETQLGITAAEPPISAPTDPAVAPPCPAPADPTEPVDEPSQEKDVSRTTPPVVKKAKAGSGGRRKGAARDAATAAVVAQINTRGVVDRSAIYSDPVALDNEAVGRYFLTWVRKAIDAGTPGFAVNDADGHGLVHRIPEGMFLVHPRIIQRFVLATGLVDGLPDTLDGNRSPELKQAVDTVRKCLKQEKLLAVTAKGYDVHQADVSMARNPFVTGMLYGIVTPTWAFYDAGEQPPINAAISLWQGEYRTGTRLRPRGRR